MVVFRCFFSSPTRCAKKGCCHQKVVQGGDLQTHILVKLLNEPTSLPRSTPAIEMTDYLNSLSITLIFIVIALILLFLDWFLNARFVEIALNNSNDHDTNPVPPQQQQYHSGLRRKNIISSAGIVFQYKKSHHEEEGEDSNYCVICLEKFEGGELCRVLNGCNHVYHQLCIDKWLFNDVHCPICRSSVRGERTVEDEVLDQV
ncbi:RING-H2 finger protein ATL56-like [Tripterygium wilfordii]|uniref:RING-H2 finger protein ATL56-like n=1 Tax=Tripterygium wilfordii TaxID=458696 RepID=UPI0018F810FA|nr:RING-H2 finger protein ATL56-like [Tripterygium wilfordii]